MTQRFRTSVVLAAGLAGSIACGGARPEPVAPAPAVEAAPSEPEVADEQREQREPPESRIVARNFDVAPGKFAEVNLEVDEGVEVTAAFQGNGDIEWNVHSHPVGGVAIHQEGVGSQGKISFAAASTGGYSVLWTNAGESTVSLIVSVELPAGARIVSWVPADE